MTWRVLEHGSSSVKFIVYQDLLDKAARLLPSSVKVIFLADRGFVDYQLLRHLRQSLNWHYRIRLKSNSWVWRTGKGWQQLNQFHLGSGQALMLHNVKLHKHHSVDGVNLALALLEPTWNAVVDCQFSTDDFANPTRIRVEI